jgi:type I restriction enzyme M protein
MARVTKTKEKNGNGLALGFEEKLWAAADKMRGHLDSGEYQRVALGLVSLKYISDVFDQRHTALEVGTADPKSEFYVADPAARLIGTSTLRRRCSGCHRKFGGSTFRTTQSSRPSANS